MEWTTKTSKIITQWTKDIINREKKEQLAEQIALRARDFDVVGVGSGSTSFLALNAIARKVKREKIHIVAIPSSSEIALACAALGLQTSTLLESKPDWAFDGADEVDPQNNLIKGRGGAMFFEKLVLKASAENYILVDESKLVKDLGKKFAIPVEVFPDAVHLVENCLVSIGASEINLRMAKAKDGPVITEAGNFILDVRFKGILPTLEKDIKQITGVIESGLFIGYNVEVFVS